MRSFFSRSLTSYMLFMVLLASILLINTSYASASADSETKAESAVPKEYSEFYGTWKGLWDSKYRAEFNFINIKSDGTATVIYKRESKTVGASTVNKESRLAAVIKDGVANIDTMTLKLDPANKNKAFGRGISQRGGPMTAIFTRAN